MSRAVIVCPLKREARALRLAVRSRIHIIVSGPGPDRIARVCADILSASKSEPKPKLILLCGLAGGLSNCQPVPRVAKIINQDASTFVPPVCMAPDDASISSITLLGLDEPVTTPERKSTHAQSFGASLVDCESHVFARFMDQAGVQWGVIRGVSDGPKDRLPEDIGSWVTASGGVKLWYVLFRLLIQPTLLPTIIRVALRSRRALRRVGVTARELLITQGIDPFAQPKI